MADSVINVPTDFSNDQLMQRFYQVLLDNINDLNSKVDKIQAQVTTLSKEIEALKNKN